MHTNLMYRKYTTIRAYWLAHDEAKLSHGFPCTFPAETERVVTHRINPFTLRLMAQTGVSTAASVENLIAGQTPVYEQTWSVMNETSDETLNYSLPAVVANVVTIELAGKNVEQNPGSGYFACVESLDCKGIPL